MNTNDGPIKGSALPDNRCIFVASGIVIHAALLLITGTDRLLSAQLWTVLGWAWLLWIPALVLVVRRFTILLWLPLLISFALIAPVAPQLLAFSAWSISGFAP